MSIVNPCNILMGVNPGLCPQTKMDKMYIMMDKMCCTPCNVVGKGGGGGKGIFILGPNQTAFVLPVVALVFCSQN